ncbi:methyl-accepting chemotaxis protein [Bacterioplanoides sp.]|uniref:methyl-accepting chemotaxis protein n=1 Tax=Bacterioplanoides sp. TaxID=2066072 RepID=UPI003B5CF71E
MKFAHKIVITSSVILAISLITLSLNQYFNVKQQIDKQVSDSVDEIVTAMSMNIQEVMATKADLTAYSVSQLGSNFSDEHFREVFSQPIIKKHFLLAGLGRESDGSFIGNDPNWSPSNYDPRKRMWYQEAKSQGKLLFTAPYADAATGEILISTAMPVYESGRFYGAIFTDVSLKGLAEISNRANLFGAGYAFIVSADGDFIAHPEAKYNGKPMSEVFGSQLNTASSEPVAIELNGKKTWVQFNSLDGLGWHLGVALNDDIVHASIYSLRNDAIIYSLIAIALAIVVLGGIINKLMQPLRELNDAMRDVATGEGDLTRRLKTNSDVEFASLAKNFNIFAEKLQDMIRRVKEIGDNINDSTARVAAGAASSASAMTQQSEEVEHLATAMTEMASTASEVASNAQSAAEAVQTADDAVGRGVEAVSHTVDSIANLSEQIEQAVDKVQELEQDTASIESILGVINEIAGQTNLLALNAAIEAARAGESGRGFAVVADEVRSLAARTQDSTSEIRDKIEKLQGGVAAVVSVMDQSKNTTNDTVERVEMANQTNAEVRESIRKITDMNLQIASAAEEQSLVAEEMNRNTSNISSLSQQVKESAANAASSMEHQVGEVREHERLLNQFVV